MVAALTANPTLTQTAQAQPASPQPHPSFFHRLLSELNPLQYVPVVGTIYRAITGDVIPESARFAGSLVVSGLTSGPIGLAINLGASALEKLTGIDPDAMGTRLLADIGIGSKAAPATTYATTAPPAPKPLAPPPVIEAGSQKPWSVAQLSAYGVVQSTDGTLSRGAVCGADVLNTLELHRLDPAENGIRLAALA